MRPAWTRRLLFVTLLGAGCNSGAASNRLDASAGNDARVSDATADVELRSTCTAASPLPCPPLAYATWPMPNPRSLPLPNPVTYRVGADTAEDDVTGLIWQRTNTDKLSWQGGRDYCEALILGGFDDWRLPSRIELISIIDFTRQPTIDDRAFIDTPNDYFWSASPVSFDANLSWSVYFGAGLSAYGMVGGTSGHVRCVRGGGPGKIPRFTTTPDEVFDRNTGLTWQRVLADQQLAWSTAKSFCESLPAPSGSVWRLPTTKELQTTVDESRSNPAADLDLFPGTPASRFWTGTNLAGASDNSVYLDMRDGATEVAASGEAYYVRCVR